MLQGNYQRQRVVTRRVSSLSYDDVEICFQQGENNALKIVRTRTTFCSKIWIYKLCESRTRKIDYVM